MTSPLASRLILIFVLIFSFRASAATLTGYIVSGPDLRLKLDGNSGQTLRIEAATAVLTILRGLSDGSQIVGYGDIYTQESRVRIDGIQSVGLKELLGVWLSPKSEIFEFRDFNRLMRYLPVESSVVPSRLKMVESLEYVLTPDNVDLYSIFITDSRKKMTIGSLRLEPGIGVSRHRSVVLTVFDPETGDEAQKIPLSPVSTLL